MASRFDVIVIGAGPAGYVAAIRCTQLGLRTACVDQWLNDKNHPSLGGTCLNVGCIPSKALLESSEIYEQAQKIFSQHGVVAKGIELDLTAMMARKEKIIGDLTQGIASLFKANGVKQVNGRGKLLPNKQVEISKPGDKQTQLIEADHIILAPGSSPADLAAAPLEVERIVDSSEALAFNSVPERLGIIGAGVIGLELGSVWRRLGSEVILLEAQKQFLPITDTQIAREAQKLFGAQGLDIHLDTRVVACKPDRDKVTINYQDQSGDHQETVDKLVLAIGRCPNTVDLAAEEVSLVLDGWGLIHVDDFCCTSIPGVYAIGDAVRGPMLAHKGSEEGIMVAERIAGRESVVNYDTIPSVIYTEPEIAWVGKTEQALKAEGIDFRSGSFPFAASGRARSAGHTDGFVKILADSETDRILGVHMIGRHTSELISQAVIAMEFGASSEDIAMIMFAHPTLTEVFHEAAMAVNGNAIHIAKKRKKSS